MLCKFIPVIRTIKGSQDKRHFYKAICVPNSVKTSHYYSINAIYKYIYELVTSEIGLAPIKDNIRLYSDDKSHFIRCEHYIRGYWRLIFKIKVLSKKSALYDI
jgi:hypothetical protein